MPALNSSGLATLQGCPVSTAKGASPAPCHSILGISVQVTWNDLLCSVPGQGLREGVPSGTVLGSPHLHPQTSSWTFPASAQFSQEPWWQESLEPFSGYLCSQDSQFLREWLIWVWVLLRADSLLAQCSGVPPGKAQGALRSSMILLGLAMRKASVLTPLLTSQPHSFGPYLIVSGMTSDGTRGARGRLMIKTKCFTLYCLSRVERPRLRHWGELGPSLSSLTPNLLWGWVYEVDKMDELKQL